MPPLQPVKVVIAGPVGAGKTTFIQTLSETEVLNTEELASEQIGKDNTTVAMDFGSLMIDQYSIMLFGTPGQERFHFMWDILCEGAYGLVLLIAADATNQLPHARRILDFITSQVRLPYVLGITRSDLAEDDAPRRIADYFQLDEDRVLPLDPRSSQQCFATLYRLFGLINHNTSPN